ncbi:DUF1007 family protein [Sneathiella sp. P13V-1]|uniref:DUF1007 family protein n=1 Tax=Sneathiella sp. P13V-1 TaxID=2697366 RepID=UPI00187B1E8C|nr:DUF1007 family protein [Sneathiella sp. P13V-1]MBE7635890.1 DUF1007 family protein [Sneathiella sp. P13V-1]
MFLKNAVTRFFFWSFLVVFTAISAPVSAHPHAWIDLKTTPLFNDKGEIIGLKQLWLFDDFYSAYILQTLPKADDGLYEQKAIDELAKMNLQNLEEYKYFTVIKGGEKPLEHDAVTNYRSYVEGSRLAMEFDLPLKTPVDPKKVPVEYLVYDPIYYIEILHAKLDDAITLPKAGPCTYSLIPPSPAREQSLAAANLDRDDTAEYGFGVYFAEIVSLTCE